LLATKPHIADRSTGLLATKPHIATGLPDCWLPKSTRRQSRTIFHEVHKIKIEVGRLLSIPGLERRIVASDMDTGMLAVDLSISRGYLGFKTK
jgi:hypothetical protein